MRIFMLPFLILGIVNSLQFGDRVSSQMQTLHQQWKTPWIELPAHEMPQFKKPDSNIVKINIPHEVGIISPNSDLKMYVISCIFAQFVMFYVFTTDL